MAARDAPPALYIITDRHATGGRPLPQVIAEALSGAPGPIGSRIAVQLREPDLATRDLRALAAELRAITTAHGAALYINDRVDVALAIGADGVHLSGRSLAPDEAHRVAPGLAIAASTHSRADVLALAVAGIHFAVFGPVFDTPSKRAYGPPVGLDALASASGSVPLLALGGVTPDRVAACIAGGASGIACIRSIVSARDPKRVVTEFVAALAL